MTPHGTPEQRYYTCIQNCHLITVRRNPRSFGLRRIIRLLLDHCEHCRCRLRCLLEPVIVVEHHRALCEGAPVEPNRLFDESWFTACPVAGPLAGRSPLLSVHPELFYSSLVNLSTMTVSSSSYQVKTLPRVVAHLAKTNSDGTWSCIPRNAELSQGWRAITYLELCHGMDGMAIWLDQNIADNTRPMVISYMGYVLAAQHSITQRSGECSLNDIRYAAVELGIMKTGNLVSGHC
nr:hypothetical protein CFP56_75679 [Quercus suber]